MPVVKDEQQTIRFCKEDRELLEQILKELQDLQKKNKKKKKDD